MKINLKKRIETVLKKVKKFSWEKCTRETLKIYEEIYEK